jgi:formylmethanofuran dehydrogenase subunit B
VAIPIAQVGWDSSGDVVRMDELTLTAPQLVEGKRAGLEELLRELLKELR